MTRDEKTTFADIVADALHPEFWDSPASVHGDEDQPGDCDLCFSSGEHAAAAILADPRLVDLLARATEKAGYGEQSGDLDQYQEWGGTPREVAAAIIRSLGETK